MTTKVTRHAAPVRAPRDPLSEAGRLAAHMVGRWRVGDRVTAADYAARHPHLRADPEAVLELIAEELALRDEYGDPVAADVLAGAFPEWAAQVRALVHCQAAIGPPAAPRPPEAGEELGEFRLVAELGRGAAGRVFAAVQPALADRPVVLKLSAAGGGEHLSLARLQHTHVVPLYSAHAFPEYGLDGLCMPYFGGATLAAALAGAAALGRPPAGADLLTALRGPTPVPAPPPGPAWAAVERAGYVEAVCWVAACLADALQYAHDRGLLHLDVKPSNVLLAGDGTPMLLDFHLARPPLRAGDPPPRSLGGTPAYMPPEQTAAVQAVQWQQPVTRAVDARADVFALGLVLDEALATVRVPPSLKALIARATAADPAARYPTAADLAADLRRHLADRPLRGVRDRSPRERWAKWRRRRPLALPAVVLCGALVALAGGVVARAADRAARADALLREGTGELAAGRPAEAAAVFEAGADALAGVPFHGALRDRLDAGRRAADRARAGAALRAACDHVRPVYGAEIVPAAEAAALHTACRELWAGRDRWENPTPAERDDLLDLAVLLADLEARVGAGDTGARRRALAVLDEADARFGPRAVLDRDRAVHLRALGQPEAAAAADRRAAAAPCRTAWDHLATGRAALATGDPAGAAAHLDRAVALDPGSPWVNYYAGVARLRTDDPAGALAAFAACAAVAPDRAWCVHNRGLAYLELGRVESARADFDRALALDPGLAAARLGRAAALGRAGQLTDALADLDRAAAAGVPAAEVAYRRATLRAAAGDAAVARADLRACLSLDPAHRAARGLLEQLGERP